MSKTTIAKFWFFVISTAVCGLLFSACSTFTTKAVPPASNSKYAAAVVTGKIKSKDIEESSGIAASRCQNGVLWTHNDSGDDAFIFALNKAGESLGTWRIPNAQNIDWEDIASYKGSDGKCFVYVGEIGDNKSKRTEHAVYRVLEPNTSGADASSDRKHPLISEPAEVVRFVYPDYDQDAETLMVHPQTGDVYIVTKRISGPAGVYRLRPQFNTDTVQKLEKVAEISVPAIPNGLITGGDISADGKSVILCDYAEGYELTLPNGSSNFDDIWQQTPEPVELGKRPHGEGVTYSFDGTSIFASSEGKGAPINEVKLNK